jgi:hypothetical protein
MRIRPGIIIVIVVVFAVLIGGRQVGWFGGKPADSANNVPAPEETPDTSAAAPSPTPRPERPTAPVVPRPSPQSGPTTATATAAANTPAATQGLITNWEERIDDLLTAEGAEDKKAVEMLAMLPNLPEDGQVEAAQHISNLLPDEQYAALSPVLTNAHTAEGVLDVLMTDVLNRPNGVKLNTLLDVARVPDHPKAEEARDVLEVFVDENYGEDWTAWSNAVQKWLKENPDE